MLTIISVIVLLLTKSRRNSESINYKELKKEETKEIDNIKKINEDTPKIESTTSNENKLENEDSRVDEMLKKFDLTPMEYNKLKVKIIAKNYRYKIKDFTIFKKNPDQTIEVSLKLEASDTIYYINALVDQNTGLIKKTWGQTRYEVPEPPVITLPAK